MKVTINGEEQHGILAYLLAIPIMIFTFLVTGAALLSVALVLLSPVIVLGLILWLIAQ